MNKVLCSLLFVAIIGIVQCESFKRIHFNQGRTHAQRNLEVNPSPTSLGRAGLEGDTSAKTVVAAKISEAFLKVNDKEATTKTPMTIYLHSAESGVCSTSSTTCDSFVRLNCLAEKDCTRATSSFGIQAGKVRVNSAYQITNDYADFITLENSTAWKLTTKPVIFDSITILNAAVAKESSYGFIGLGTQDLARKNFIGTETPTFSLSVNSTGKGSLIFGNETTLIQTDRKDKALTWNTDANWIGTSSALYARYYNYTEYQTKVYLDLTQEKTSISSGKWTEIVKGFNLTTLDTKFIYNSTLMGAISRHPPIIFTIGGSNVTIPVEALFKVEDPQNPSVYTFMAESIGTQFNYNISSHPYEEVTIFGTHFLSNFYTVFSAPKEEGVSPFIQLHPIYTAFVDSTSSSSGSSLWYIIIGVIAFVLVFIAALVQKGKAKGSENSLGKSLNKPSIGLELR